MSYLIMKKCPKCDREAFELVDEVYDLEAEFEEGHPVRKETWVCHYCGEEIIERYIEKEEKEN